MPLYSTHHVAICMRMCMCIHVRLVLETEEHDLHAPGPMLWSKAGAEGAAGVVGAAGVAWAAGAAGAAG
eukprot:scaffold22031_cov69-Phaeocystis_antarctica.AAC.2